MEFAKRLNPIKSSQKRPGLFWHQRFGFSIGNADSAGAGAFFERQNFNSDSPSAVDGQKFRLHHCHQRQADFGAGGAQGTD